MEIYLVFNRLKKTVVKELTDEEALESFLDLLSNRISIVTHFVVDEQTGNLTHQILGIRCGELASVSKPERLDVVLRPATASEQGATLN